jgi:structural maintenance of chromosome 4
MITLGGNAELELVDSMDPFSEGIIFSVMPPKKSWRNISNLSGGEKVFIVVVLSHFTHLLTSIQIKTLSSLALVFALHVYKVCLTYPRLLVTSNEVAHSQHRCTLWMRLMPP